jgi:hypothetical protein
MALSSKACFLLVALGALVLINALMLAGWRNESFVDAVVGGAPAIKGALPAMNPAAPTGVGGKMPNKKSTEGFASLGWRTADAAPRGAAYEPIGPYDGIRETDTPAPAGPMTGAPDEDMFIFAKNKSSPLCCGNNQGGSFSSSLGCVCTTQAQRDFIAQRGGNLTAPDDL